MGCTSSVSLPEEPPVCPKPQQCRNTTCPPHLLTESVNKHRPSPGVCWAGTKKGSNEGYLIDFPRPSAVRRIVHSFIPATRIWAGGHYGLGAVLHPGCGNQVRMGQRPYLPGEAGVSEGGGWEHGGARGRGASCSPVQVRREDPSEVMSQQTWNLLI